MSRRNPWTTKGTAKEEVEQEVFVKWCKMNSHLHPGLACIHSIANELPYTHKLTVGHRIALYRKLANMGMVKGSPDLFIPAPVYPKHGIYVEMKEVDGNVEDVQIEVHAKLKRAGYDVIVAFGFNSAKRQLLEILNRGKQNEQCSATEKAG